MNELEEKELFETAPVHRAVMALAIPSIISQIVSIIYNLADTFYIGQLGNPYMVAAGKSMHSGGSSVCSQTMNEKGVLYEADDGNRSFTLCFCHGTQRMFQ